MCRQCLKEWLPAIDANKKVFHFKKGEVLFKEGELMSGLYFINSGSVKVHKKWGSDKELIVRFAKEGDIAGHRGLGKDYFYSVSATALEPVTVCFVDMEFFNATLKVNTEFLFQLMMFFAEELKVSEKKMRNMAHMKVKGRIAIALLSLSNKFGFDLEGFINIPLSKQDLASYAGATYETVFRIINELIEEDIIRVFGKKITILQPQVLENFTKYEGM